MSKAKYTLFKSNFTITKYMEEDEYIHDCICTEHLAKIKERALLELDKWYHQKKDEIMNLTEKSFKS